MPPSLPPSVGIAALLCHMPGITSGPTREGGEAAAAPDAALADAFKDWDCLHHLEHVIGGS